MRRVMGLAHHTTGLESVTHEVSFVPVFVRDWSYSEAHVYRMSPELASAQLASFHGCSIQPTERTETLKDNFLVKTHICAHTLYIYKKIHYIFFAWHFENAEKLLATCILMYISAANYIHIYAHMLMSKPNNFHWTLTDYINILVKRNWRNALNRDDVFRCP